MATVLAIFAPGCIIHISNTRAKEILDYLIQYDRTGCLAMFDKNSREFVSATKLLSDFIAGALPVNSTVHGGVVHTVQVTRTVADNIRYALSSCSN